MPVTFTHSRAAILCFGGWGLQTLLHLAPRIQAAQEQRAAQGAADPDLNRITSFGVVLPDPLLTGSDLVQFTLRKLRGDRPLTPFYVERILAEIDGAPPKRPPTPLPGLYSHAERRRRRPAASGLLVHLQTLQFEVILRSPAGAAISLRLPRRRDRTQPARHARGHHAGRRTARRLRLAPAPASSTPSARTSSPDDSFASNPRSTWSRRSSRWPPL